MIIINIYTIIYNINITIDLLISQHQATPVQGSKVVMARVRKYRQAQGQARQTKSKKENRYEIKVTRLSG
jgi:hypothetical protein